MDLWQALANGYEPQRPDGREAAGRQRDPSSLPHPEGRGRRARGRPQRGRQAASRAHPHLLLGPEDPNREAVRGGGRGGRERFASGDARRGSRRERRALPHLEEVPAGRRRPDGGERGAVRGRLRGQAAEALAAERARALRGGPVRWRRGCRGGQHLRRDGAGRVEGRAHRLLRAVVRALPQVRAALQGAREEAQARPLPQDHEGGRHQE
mmetsp:Transcript_119307/g.323666  ORF Transcript_119307/g.323666 Transcript_119307/m.323666 type:complete len:210 (-) Transcript_119307:350-979(-)